MPLAAGSRQEPAVDVCSRCERNIPDEGVLCQHCSPWEPPPSAAHQPAEEVLPGAGVGRRQLLLIAAAVIGGGVITLAALRGGGAEPAPSAPAVDAARPAASVATTVTPEPDEPAAPATWIDNGSMWLASSQKGIALELPARNETSVWMRTVRPLLVVRCVGRRTDVFVFTDSAIAMEAQDPDHTVRIRLDDGPDRVERWPDSSSHDALFAPDGRRLLSELSGARGDDLRLHPP